MSYARFIAVAAWVALASVAHGGNRVTIGEIANACSHVCVFSLCISPEYPPEARACPPEAADMTIRLRTRDTAEAKRPIARKALKMNIRGTAVRLLCTDSATYPCFECERDADCADKPFGQQCVEGFCGVRPSCE